MSKTQILAERYLALLAAAREVLKVLPLPEDYPVDSVERKALDGLRIQVELAGMKKS